VFHFIHPGYVVGLLIILATSQLLYAFFPYRRRRYLPVLVASAVGFVFGEVWALLGLPALQLGDANLLPGVFFAVLLQPVADLLAITFPARGRTS
jgi:hypothetical protein